MVKKQWYLCKAKKELSNEDLLEIAKRLQCTVSEIGQVKDQERWDYWLRDKAGLTGEELDLLNEKGLTVLLGPGQDEGVDMEKENILWMNLKSKPQTHIFMYDQGDHGPFGKNPWLHDSGYVHPDKKY